MKYITLGIALFLFSSNHVSAGDIDSFFESMKKYQTKYQDKNISQDKRAVLIEKYNIPKMQEVVKKNTEIIKSLQKDSDKALGSTIPWIAKNMNTGIKDDELKNITNSILGKTKDDKVDTIFYLFSTSQTEFALKNFMQDVVKLEAINKRIKYYGVVQGMLSKEQLDVLYNPFRFDKELQSKAKIKMQPFIFKDLQLNRVPAYLFSKCSSTDFKYKECENKYLVRGDISLAKALDIATKEDKEYHKYLKLLEQGDY